MDSVVSSNVDGSPGRSSLQQKKVIFYPDMADVNKKNKMLYSFLQKDYGDPFGDAKIDPDQVDHQNPDFGFNNYLIFEGESKGIARGDGTNFSNSWKFFMDYTAFEPKYERLKHYIEFINEQKYNEMEKKLAGGKRPSIIGKVKHLNPKDK